MLLGQNIILTPSVPCAEKPFVAPSAYRAKSKALCGVLGLSPPVPNLPLPSPQTWNPPWPSVLLQMARLIPTYPWSHVHVIICCALGMWGHKHWSSFTFTFTLLHFRWKLLAIQRLEVGLTRDRFVLSVGQPKRSKDTKRNPLILMEAFRQRSSLPQKPSGKGAEGPKDALEGRRGSSLGVAESTQEVSVSSVSR